MFFINYMNLVFIVILLVFGGLFVWLVLCCGCGGLLVVEVMQFINCCNVVVIDLCVVFDFVVGYLLLVCQVVVGEIGVKIVQVVKNKSILVLFVCQNGQQLQKVVCEVEVVGYVEVYVFEGGVVVWQQVGMLVVK